MAEIKTKGHPVIRRRQSEGSIWRPKAIIYTDIDINTLKALQPDLTRTTKPVDEQQKNPSQILENIDIERKHDERNTAEDDLNKTTTIQTKEVKFDVVKECSTKPHPVRRPYKKSDSCPSIAVSPKLINPRKNIETETVDPDYERMVHKAPTPLPPRDDLSELSMPRKIDTNFKELQFMYEAFLSHIYHVSDPFRNNFKQGNFAAGIFNEEGGTLKLTGAHLTIPNGALKQATGLFIYQTESKLAESNQNGGLQYQVTPTILVGPKTAIEEYVFLTINLYVLDATDWNYTSLTRESNEISMWKHVKDSNLSIQHERRWIHTLEEISTTTEFKINGSPKRKDPTDSDGLYDIPIDHFITVKMSTVIDDVNNELSIIVRIVEKSTEIYDSNAKIVLLNQLGGEFLIMKVFGEEEKIHIGNILCGRQTSTKYSLKIPKSAYIHAPIGFRQELKEHDFHLSINPDISQSNTYGGIFQWKEDIRTFATILTKIRFRMIIECGQCDHWVIFCKCAFNFSDAQSEHFRTISFCGSFAINMYTAVYDTSGNTIDVLRSLKELLEKSDILQAAKLVEEEIKDLVSLCEDKRGSGYYVMMESRSEEIANDEDEEHMGSMHASLRRRTLDRKH